MSDGHLKAGVLHVVNNGLSKAREAPARSIAIDIIRQIFYLMQSCSQEIARQPILSHRQDQVATRVVRAPAHAQLRKLSIILNEL